MRVEGIAVGGYTYGNQRPDLPTQARPHTPPLPREWVSPIVLAPIPQIRKVVRREPTVHPKTEQIVALYRDGRTIAQIRVALGVSWATVKVALDRYGIERNTGVKMKPRDDWFCVGGCGRKLRPMSADPAEWPADSMVHAGHGCCAGCLHRKRREARAGKAAAADRT